jgi:hypothetical protein
MSAPTFKLPFDPDLILGPPVWGAFLAAFLGGKFVEEAIRYWCNSGKTDRAAFRVCVAAMCIVTPLGLITSCVYVCKCYGSPANPQLTCWDRPDKRHGVGKPAGALDVHLAMVPVDLDGLHRGLCPTVPDLSPVQAVQAVRPRFQPLRLNG